MVLFDNLDRERKMLFTADHMILVCEGCVSYFFNCYSYIAKEKATSLPNLLKMLISYCVH